MWEGQGVKVYATSGAWRKTLRCAWLGCVSGVRLESFHWQVIIFATVSLSEVLRTAFRAPRLNSGDLVTVSRERELKSVELIHLVQRAQPRPITAVVPVSLRGTSL